MGSNAISTTKDRIIESAVELFNQKVFQELPSAKLPEQPMSMSPTSPIILMEKAV